MDSEKIQAASRRLSELEIAINVDGSNVIVNWFRAMVKTGDWNIPRHSHTSFEFHFIAEGNCTVQTDSEVFVASRGDFYLTPPNVHHAQFRHLSDTFIEYSLDIEFHHGRESAYGEMSSVHQFLSDTPCHLFHDDQGIIPLFDRSLEEAYNRRPGYSIAINALFLEILVLATRAMGYGTSQSIGQSRNENGHSRMDLIANFVHDNILDPISPADIASFMNLSEKQISRIVLASEGFSTKKYIIVSKIEEAKRLLLSTDMSISAISKVLSFSSPSYFVNVFTRNEGVSPGTFRASERVRIQN